MKSTSILRKTPLVAVVTVAALAAATCNGGAIAAASDAIVSVARPAQLQRGDAIVGTLAQSQPIHVEVALKLRDRAGLDAFVAHAGRDQGAMSRSQFMARHAPTDVQARTVANYLERMGYTHVVIAPNRLLVSADGTAATAQRAFLTMFARVRMHDGRIAFANTDEVRVPAALRDSVLAVLGLQNVHVAHTFAREIHPDAAHPLAITGHNPVEFASIYGAAGAATAAGVTVGIFTQGKITQSITDLNAFTAAHGFANVTTQTVNTNGTGNDTAGIGEWDLDSQDIVGMAGGQVGRIIWYNTPTLTSPDMTANFNTIVIANAAKIINVSIGGCETDSQNDGSAAAQDQIFAQAVAQGQTFSISTGDSGADECGDGGTTPSWPAASQYVIAAAGTTLNASKTTWSSETVWAGSGGSQSKFEPKPYWQAPLWTGAHRGVADVAFDGDPNSGAKVIVKGKNTQIGGTSLSAPLFAGEWARVIAVAGPNIGFAGPKIYNLPATDFHDVTSGSNGISAAAGYDLASGRGSMILGKAIADLVSDAPPLANFSFSTSGMVATFTDASTDSTGTIASHAWNFGDGGTSTATNPSHTYAAAGTYSVSETIIDNRGSSASTTKSVTVPGANHPPVANFSYLNMNGTSVAFTDTSSDSDGTIASHAWTFGDGGTSTAANPTHVFMAGNNYNVTETVTDNAGASASKTQVVQIATIEPQFLLANTGFETTGSWTATTGVICNTGCSGQNPHAGVGFAWMGGYSVAHTDTLSQQTVAPLLPGTVALQFYLHIDTAEASTTKAYDTLTVAVYNSSGALLKTLATYSNLNHNIGYTMHSFDMSAYIGQRVTVKFTAVDDASSQTSFVLDDVTMNDY